MRLVKRAVAARPAAAAAAVPAPAAVGGAGAAAGTPMSFDAKDDAKAAIVRSAREYLADPPAMIALLYRTRALYETCPPGVPSSELGRNRHGADFQIAEHFNHPHGMKSLNAMLRHAFNFFNEFCRKMNFNDYEATSERGNVVFFHARAVRNEIATVFSTLSDVSSKTKEKEAEKVYRRILDCITSMPPTPAEREREREREREHQRRAAALAAAEDARRAEEAERAKKAASDAFAAANGGLRPEECW